MSTAANADNDRASRPNMNANTQLSHKEQSVNPIITLKPIRETALLVSHNGDRYIGDCIHGFIKVTSTRTNTNVIIITAHLTNGKKITLTLHNRKVKEHSYSQKEATRSHHNGVKER